MTNKTTQRKTPKPKQIGVSEELKNDLDLLGELQEKSQSELMNDIFNTWKKENPKSWKKLQDYRKLKASIK